MRRWKRSVKIIGINIAVLVALALVVEAALGGWWRAPGLWLISVYRDVDWRLIVSDKYQRNGPTRYRRDYYGLRGDFGAPENVNIVTLGGSTTDERFVSEGETWTDQLSACLHSRGLEARIANAGVSGQSTRGHAYNYEVWLNRIPKFRPKYGLAFIGINERNMKAAEARDDPTRFTEAATPHRSTKTLRRWIRMNSAIYGGYRIVRGNIAAFRSGLHDLKQKIDHIPNPTNQTWVVTLSRGYDWSKSMTVGSAKYRTSLENTRNNLKLQLDQYKGRLTRLRDTLVAHGSEPIFITQSWGGYRLKDGVITGDIPGYFGLKVFNEATLNFCSSSDLFCVDIGDGVEFEHGDFYDEAHTTPTGSKKIGFHVCSRLLGWKGFTLKAE